MIEQGKGVVAGITSALRKGLQPPLQGLGARGDRVMRLFSIRLIKNN